MVNAGSILVSLLSLVLLLPATTGSHGIVPRSKRPPRCCSPDQWEADIKNFGVTTRARDPTGMLSGRFAYDYTNLRWAIDYRDASDSKNSRRLVFDHRKNSKYVVMDSACYNVTLNMAEMDRYCIPANASYVGYFDYGLNTETIGYDIWVYDTLFMPIRVVLQVSRDGCIPLQDSALSLIRNHWQWDVGEPICNPWEFPEEAFNGECFRSHVEHTEKRSASRPGGMLHNMDFRNINLTITSEEIFSIPASCQSADDWPAEIKWYNFWAMLLLRRKTD